MSYDLLYRHDDFYLIDKHAGVNLHRNQRGSSLLDTLRHELGDEALYLVHRLDDATSGLLLIARNKSAAAQLSAQFSERHVQKFYIALADGKPRKKQGLVVGDIVKARNGSYRLSRSRDNPSRTRFISSAVMPGLRLYLLKPHTGKTHQLRVVMSSLGVPILGDERYGKTEADRCYLHAFALCFDYGGHHYQFCQQPSSGQRFVDRAVQEALVEWRQPWALNWGK